MPFRVSASGLKALLRMLGRARREESLAEGACGLSHRFQISPDRMHP
ncbi:MAG: hypothetical protein V5B59_17725 [Candidatus Accumulibacter contiguus]